MVFKVDGQVMAVNDVQLRKALALMVFTEAGIVNAPSNVQPSKVPSDNAVKGVFSAKVAVARAVQPWNT